MIDRFRMVSKKISSLGAAVLMSTAKATSGLMFPQRYLEQTYGLTAPHSEVVELLQKYPELQPSSTSTDTNSNRSTQQGQLAALDLGCGRGRNTFYLQQRGYTVTALDKSEKSIATLNDIMAKEASSIPAGDIHASIYDIALASVPPSQHSSNGLYNLVLSTVVLQFLPADCIPAVMANLQAQTNSHGGIHLIVAPLSTPQHPCPINFPFTLKEGELQSYYPEPEWTILKYEETMGEFHKTDDQGNRLKALFATLVAQKQSTGVE